jgi:RNA 2',3'-cyclic 3'-phosphodiesterase
MPRIRSFIAVEMSPRVVARVGELIDKLRVASQDITWVRQQQMHITLKFLGDVADTETPDICRVVRGVAERFEPFEITCRGAGAFPSTANPRTLWIGVQDGAEELKQLQAAIDEALKKELGFAKEQRGFHPHLTIGRLKRDVAGGRDQLASLLAEHAQFDADLAVVDEVVTFASFLGRGGPTHDALDHAELGARRSKRDELV